VEKFPLNLKLKELDIARHLQRVSARVKRVPIYNQKNRVICKLPGNHCVMTEPGSGRVTNVRTLQGEIIWHVIFVQLVKYPRAGKP